MQLLHLRRRTLPRGHCDRSGRRRQPDSGGPGEARPESEGYRNHPRAYRPYRRRARTEAAHPSAGVYESERRRAAGDAGDAGVLAGHARHRRAWKSTRRRRMAPRCNLVRPSFTCCTRRATPRAASACGFRRKRKLVAGDTLFATASAAPICRAATGGRSCGRSTTSCCHCPTRQW